MLHDLQPLIKLEKVNVSRDGRTILNNLDWQICNGQNWAIIGANGSGKTLLMQVVQGRIPCSGGEVVYSSTVDSQQIAQVSFELHHQIIAREQGQVFVRDFSKSKSEGTTVAEFLEIPIQSDENADDAIVHLLSLQSLLTSSLLTLSNGEMRKLLIARALRRNPYLLILDEPYDGLDSDSRKVLKETIHFMASVGVQFLMVTHRLEEISEDISHVLCLQDGKVVYNGTRDEALKSDMLAAIFNHSEITEKQVFQGMRDAKLAIPKGHKHNGPTVVMRDVTVTYGSRVVLDQLNWTVQPEDHWAIVGPNGAGKSTLLRLISADHPQAYANDITLFGAKRGSGESIWDIKQRVGVLSPELQIHYRRDMLVADLVVSGFFDSIGLYRRPSDAQQATALAWLQFLEMDQYSEHRFDQLSYGQKRIILLARALVKYPKMLLLDEPCQGLDAENSRRLNRTVSAIAEASAMQIMYVTHRRDEFPACITHILEFCRICLPGQGAKRYTAEIQEIRK